LLGTNAETMEILKRGAAAAAAVVRGLHDERLATSGTVLTDAPPMAVEQLVTGGLIGQIGAHVGGIRKTVGHYHGPRATSGVRGRVGTLKAEDVVATIVKVIERTLWA
jgi:hypothetical protein